MGLLKVALVGYGHLGKWHCQKILDSKEAELVAIVDKFNTISEFKSKLSDKYPNLKLCSDISEIINEIDAAIVVTPTSTHYELCEYLIENKKHVFCEKPMTSSLDDAIALEDLLEKEKSLVFQVGHSERFHKCWEHIDDFSSYFQSKSQVQISRLAPFKGRATDVDVVWDLMIHDLDLLIYHFKEVPKLIDAYGFKNRTNKWDVVNAQFILPISNTRVLVQSSRNHVEEIRVVEVVNEKGTLLIDLLNNKILFTLEEGTSDGKYVKEINCGKNDHLFLEHKFFYDSIKNNKRAVVDVNDGLLAIKCVQEVLDHLNKNEDKKSFSDPDFVDIKN